MIEKTEGCNFMTCLCGKEFCFKCGAIEIDDHKCINACVLFDIDEPDNKIKRNLRRDIKQHEKDSIAKLRQAFIDKTKKDREFVQRYYRTEPKGWKVRQAMERIFDEGSKMQRSIDRFIDRIMSKEDHEDHERSYIGAFHRFNHQYYHEEDESTFFNDEDYEGINHYRLNDSYE